MNCDKAFLAVQQLQNSYSSLYFWVLILFAIMACCFAVFIYKSDC